MLDLSASVVAANTYCLLRDMWWPHPAHGQIEMGCGEDLVVFRCACGDEVAFPLSVAHDFGIVG